MLKHGEVSFRHHQRKETGIAGSYTWCLRSSVKRDKVLGSNPPPAAINESLYILYDKMYIIGRQHDRSCTVLLTRSARNPIRGFESLPTSQFQSDTQHRWVRFVPMKKSCVG